jgi:hypothetical protein
MSTCRLIQRDSGDWMCQACGRTLRVKAKRICKAAPDYVAPDPLTARLTEMRINGQWGVDGATVEERLATCRACPQWHRDHCDHYRGATTCEQRTRYAAAVVGLIGLSGPKIPPCDQWQDAAAADWRAVVRTPSI